MPETLSKEVQSILAQADVVARATGKATTSVHYLVATYLVECQARELLVETGVDEVKVLDTFEKMQEREDSAQALSEIHRQAEQLAESTQSQQVSTTILLASLLRVRNALASKVLERAGVNLPGLRARVIGQVTLSNDRAGQTGSRPIVRHPDDRSPSRTDLPRTSGRMDAVHPALPTHSTAQRPLEPDARSISGIRRLPLGAPIDQMQARQQPPSEAQGPPTQRLAQLSLPQPTLRQAPVAQPTPVSHPMAPPRALEMPAQPSATKPRATTKAHSHAQVFDLSADQYPTLLELGRNLTEAALRGEIDPVIGRDDIIESVIDILLMKQVNNPCLIGEAGVGKTAIAEGLALKIAGNVEQYGRLGSALIVEIQTSSLLAGTALRGAFSERMRKLRDEVAKADGQVIIFMDEIHTIMGAGTGDGPLDAANDLKSALARGKFPLIGATTKTEYERHIEKDPAMERRFQVVAVPEPTVPQAIAILSGVAPIYAQHHGVRYSHDAIASAVHLSKRFINDRCLPDKAIAVLDRAGAQTKRAGRPQVMADDIARAVHVLTAVPMERLLADERGRIRDLAADLQARIVGHDAAMLKVARRIQRNYAGFSGDRPLASFLFVGAPGVGKTETARALADVLFNSSDALVRFDMTEYSEAHSLARLIGSPPGYVGHGQSGLLAQALQKRPYRVLLFDEIDRAAPEVLALMLQLLDAGRLTDNHGHVVDVRNCIIAMTSNLGSEILTANARKKSIGFGSIDAPLPENAGQDGPDTLVLDRARAGLSGEFWSRIDDAIVFRPLALTAAKAVAWRTLQSSAARLFESRLITFTVDDAVVELLLEGGVDPALGVRPLRARIEALVEAFVADCILDGRLQPGAIANIGVEGGKLILQQPPELGIQSASVA